MRILHIINSLKVAGAEVMLSSICPELVKKGHTVQVHTLATGDPKLLKIMSSGGVIVSGGRELSPYKCINIFEVIKLLKENSFDVIHVHLFPAQLFFSLASLLLNINNAITTEHSTSNRRRGNLLLRLVDRFIYSRFNKVICISDATKKNFDEWLPEYTNKSIVIENGIDLDRFIVNSNNKKNIDGKIKLITIGRLEKVKNIKASIQALTLLPDCTLDIVGDGPQKNELMKLAKQLGVQESVRFLGMRSDVPELLRMADIYIQTSLWEGFSIATVEAMASGLPVVVSDVPGLSDVVGDAGLKFTSDDFVELANKISVLCTDCFLRKNMGKLSLDRATKYSIEYNIEKTIRLYENTQAGQFV